MKSMNLNGKIALGNVAECSPVSGDLTPDGGLKTAAAQIGATLAVGLVSCAVYDVAKQGIHYLNRDKSKDAPKDKGTKKDKDAPKDGVTA